MIGLCVLYGIPIDSEHRFARSIEIEATVDESRKLKLTEVLGEQFFPAQYVQQIHAATAARAKSRTHRSLLILALLLALLALVLLFPWLEGIATGAALISPLSAPLLWTTRFLGSIGAIVLFLLLSVSPKRDSSFRFKRVIAVGLVVLFGAIWADTFTWHAAHFYEFAASNANFEQVVYPVSDLRSHRSKSGLSSGHDVVVDPFHTGESLNIPIPSEQYQDLMALGSPLCIEVRQRRSRSGAIEVYTYTKYTWRQPMRLKIKRC